MADSTEKHPMVTTRIAYEAPGIDGVTVKRDIEYRSSDKGSLTLDVYHPPDSRDPGDARWPVAILILGYADVGVPPMPQFNCTFKEMAWTISWAETLAASGIAAILYTTSDPVSDAHELLRYVRANADALGLDAERIGIWSGSGHSPTAMSVLMDPESTPSLKCATFSCGFMLDLGGSKTVAEAAAAYRFMNPNAGKGVDDLPADLPMFIARAGREQFPGLNDAIDRFVAAALARNLPLTVVNHVTGRHGFEWYDPSDTTREIIKQTLAFMRFHLGA
jgi:hypothetical protein